MYHKSQFKQYNAWVIFIYKYHKYTEQNIDRLQIEEHLLEH